MTQDYMSMPVAQLVRRWSIRRDTSDPSRLHAVVQRQSDAEILRARKPEILAYLAERDAQRAAEDAARAQESAARKARLDDIEGLRDLQAAVNAWARYHEEREKAMDSEFGTPWAIEKPTCSVDALRTQYPRAAAYLKAESWAQAAHYVKASAGRKAAEAILRGEPHEAAIAAMEAEWESQCSEHFEHWD